MRFLRLGENEMRLRLGTDERGEPGGRKIRSHVRGRGLCRATNSFVKIARSPSKQLSRSLSTKKETSPARHAAPSTSIKRLPHSSRSLQRRVELTSHGGALGEMP